MIIDYNLSRDYCGDWTAIEAIREIVQNAMDSGEYECNLRDTQLSIISTNGSLTPDVFSMGVSRKTEGAIGKYGEGFKIAMLVLTRLNLRPVLRTGDMLIEGFFSPHEFTGVETFKLSIERTQYDYEGVSFTCYTKDVDLTLLKERITPFAEHPLPKVERSVDILHTRPGKIYVNGLFVCEDNSLSLGYNFAPSAITLNRDRNMTEGHMITLGKYFAGLPESEASTVFNLVENEAVDVSYLSCYVYKNHKLRAELARLFFNKYGEGATIARPGAYYGAGTSGVSMGYNRHSLYKACGVKEAVEAVSPDSPLGIINSFIATNKKFMRRDLRKAFDVLANQAKAWKK